jgi:hypothetical protein
MMILDKTLQGNTQRKDRFEKSFLKSFHNYRSSSIAIVKAFGANIGGLYRMKYFQSLHKQQAVEGFGVSYCEKHQSVLPFPLQQPFSRNA